MYRKEVNEKSPLRLLESSIHGGLGAGNLGVVMARAGTGKTAFLVQIALDDLMRDRDVLHFALGQRLEHVRDWYDAIFDDHAELSGLDDKEAVRAAIMQRRVIQAHADHKLQAEQVERAVQLYATHLQLRPKVILVDGFDWEGPVAEVAGTLGALKAIAKRLGAELWMTAQTHRQSTPAHPVEVPPPCSSFVALVDVAVFLEPHGAFATVRILKDHDAVSASSTHLQLEMDTMRLIEDGATVEAPVSSRRLPPAAFTLLSGAARGAESEFGAAAEEWGVGELNFSFEGRPVERRRGVMVLDEQELARGRVSHAYLQAQMHRQYPNTPQFQRMLDTIWHQVNTAGEVFVVGSILADGTVKGGTGWAAELARHWHKPLYVFDQERGAWQTWKDGAWSDQGAPTITKTRFTGTGTRFLTDDGRRAIRDLFARSFGA